MIYFIYIFLFNEVLNSVISISSNPILIVVSFDAFRSDYINETSTPNLYRLRAQGTSCDYMKNIFPTKTYPNHFSIGTGLYAETHGVTGNSVYDSRLNKIITYGQDLFNYNPEVVPIWTLNQRAGFGRHSGSIMWPGSSFKYQGISPTFTQIWNPTIRFKERVDLAISWLTHPRTPANLIMLYFEEPDEHAHVFGIQSETAQKYIREVDEVALYLETQLISHGLHERADVIHVSDHGMINVTPQKIINLTAVLEPNSVQYADSSPSLHVIPAKGKKQEVYKRLKSLSQENQHFHVYLREEMPEKWHYKHGKRVPPIFALAEPGYTFQDFNNLIFHYVEAYGRNVSCSNMYGIHGYDNDIREMNAFFMARGPTIRKNHRIEPFNNVDLFSLFCHILHLIPVPNNGSFQHVAGVLIEKEAIIVRQVSSLYMTVGAAFFSLLFLGCVGCTVIWLARCKKMNEEISTNRRFGDEVGFSLSDVGLIESQQLLFSDSDEN